MKQKPHKKRHRKPLETYRKEEIQCKEEGVKKGTMYN